MVESFDVAIVGASLAGSRVAELVARQACSVLLIEEHKQIGFPCKCAGLVSWRLRELLPDLPKKIIINKARKAKFFSPNGNFFVLKSRKPVYVVDRPALDKFLFAKALREGASIRFEKYESFRRMKKYLKIRTNENVYRAKLLIGADGANSLVRRQAGLFYPKNFLVGLQSSVKGDFDLIELWFGSEISPNFFGWVIPEDGSARIGLATNSNQKLYYEKFLQKRVGKVVRPNVSGIIRYGLMKETAAERVMVVGDAACQVKPVSGGGIIYSLICSKICAAATLHALESQDFSKKFLKIVYDRKWKEKLGKPIRRGLFLRKILSSSDTNLNFLFSVAKFATRILNNLDMDFLNFA